MAQIRIGIIGAGGRGINTFGNLFHNQFGRQTRLAALADVNRTRAEAGRDHLGAEAEIYEDYRDMLARKDLDAAVITSPDYLHEEHCLAAIKSGKHVLVDKPLAVSGAGCLRIIAAARKSGRLLYMGFNLRHNTVLARIKALLDRGDLGRIFAAHAVEYYDGGRTYMARWNRLKEYSGGLFIHKGSHDFDIINWYMQPARPVRVSCFGGVFTLNPGGLPFKTRRGVKPGPTCKTCAYHDICPDKVTRTNNAERNAPLTEKQATRQHMFDAAAAKVDGYHRDLCIYFSDKDTHDQGMAIVEYDNGATAVHTECFVTPLSNRLYRLDGTLGHCNADLSNRRVEIMPRWSSERIEHHLQSAEGGHGGADPVMCRDFITCIRKGLRPRASGIDGAWSVAIGEACELSRAEKRTVRIDEVLNVRSPLLK